MSRERALDASWQGWLRENIERGCDCTELVAILRKHGFSQSSIQDNMGAAFPATLAMPVIPAEPPRLIRRAPQKLRKIESNALDLYTLDDFLSVKECDRVVALINHHLRPSTTTRDNGDRYFRTSRTCDLSLLKSPVAIALDQKICKTLGIRPEYAEGTQAQRYDVGQQFKAHTDYFEPGTEDFERFGGPRGNRTWTFMVYLNEGMEGGGTRFPEINHTFLPRKGQAVLWNNLNPDGTPNAATRHSGEPVLGGQKIIITKWFRQLGSGPMYFEDP